MLGLTRMLAVLLAMVTFEIALAGAVENPPDDYLCYAAGSTKNKKLAPISGARIVLQDRFGGLQRFVIRRLSTLCDPAGIDGDTVSHGNVHLVGFILKREKTAPKFVPFTQAVTDRFGTRTLELTGLATLLDVTPVQPGTTYPADFTDDPTQSAIEVNRFKCYTAALPKGAPKFAPPAPPTVADEAFVGGQRFVIRKVTKVCLPADVEGATPGAAARDTLRVCYAVKLPTGGRYHRLTVGTRSRAVGVRIVGRWKPTELCVTGRLLPGS
jgi:hypothetical protein